MAAENDGLHIKEAWIQLKHVTLIIIASLKQESRRSGSYVVVAILLAIKAQVAYVNPLSHVLAPPQKGAL